MREQLAYKARPLAEELKQVKAERDDALRLANYCVQQLPDVVEREAVAVMGFFGRLYWALGVALTGRFRWQRCKDN